MKKLISALLLICLTVLPLTSLAADDVLNVYNWGEYIDKQVIYDFEKEFNCRVNYSIFSSNEDMYIKQKANSYDVMIPSDYMIERLLKETLTRTTPTAFPTCGRPSASSMTRRKSILPKWRKKVGTSSWTRNWKAMSICMTLSAMPSWSLSRLWVIP